MHYSCCIYFISCCRTPNEVNSNRLYYNRSMHEVPNYIEQLVGSLFYSNLSNTLVRIDRMRISCSHVHLVHPAANLVYGLTDSICHQTFVQPLNHGSKPVKSIEKELAKVRLSLLFCNSLSTVSILTKASVQLYSAGGPLVSHVFGNFQTLCIPH